MLEMTRICRLLDRLWLVCRNKPDFGGDLWNRGVAVIERKQGVRIWLDKFEPKVHVQEKPFAIIEVSKI